MKVRGDFLATAAVSLGKQHAIPIGQDTGWAPESVWTLWNREKFLIPARNPTLAV
jgi:hypothetical protein